MGNFEVIAAPTDERLDPEVFREVGSVVGSYVGQEVANPVTVALRDALEEPIDPSQILNTAVGFANTVALLALAVTQDEQSAARVVRETLRLGNDAQDADAETLILRLLEPMDRAPEQISGKTLTSIANYGDMAVRLTDQLGIARQTLAEAVSAAAAKGRLRGGQAGSPFCNQGRPCLGSCPWPKRCM
jgi:hypothetical protein